MLNEDSIRSMLTQTREHIEAGNLQQALSHLQLLGFNRLLQPLRNPTKGPLRFVDPADGFGPTRVHETGDYIRACQAALQSERTEAARDAISRAIDRWNGSRV
jgi:hypothetical protein